MLDAPHRFGIGLARPNRISIEKATSANATRGRADILAAGSWARSICVTFTTAAWSLGDGGSRQPDLERRVHRLRHQVVPVTWCAWAPNASHDLQHRGGSRLIQR